MEARKKKHRKLLNGKSSYEDSEEKLQVNGMKILPFFISEEDELQLLKEFESTLKTKLYFGFRYDEETNSLTKSEISQIPNSLQEIAQRLVKEKILQKIPNQITIDKVSFDLSAPFIERHSLFEEPIVLLRLGRDVIFDFLDPFGNEETFPVAGRSIVVLTENSRYVWSRRVFLPPTDESTASVAALPTNLGITFRICRDPNSPCTCPFSAYCDSQLNSETNHLDQTKVETQYVFQVYDAIASHFSNTRYKPWPKIEEFLLNLPPGSLVADAGCGNGKYLSVNPSIAKIGCDSSSKLIEICQERGLEAFVSDIRHLPFRNSSFDVVISIAVIHHLSTPERRLDALKEVNRILRVGGQLLCYVWALEQEGRKFTKQDVFVPWHLKDEFKSNQSNFDSKCENNKDGSSVFQRYYHVFKKGELEELFNQIPNFQIEKSYYDRDNWCVLAKKINE